VSTSTSTPASVENDISTDKERTTACEKIDSKNSDPLPNGRKRTRDDTNTTSKENNHSNNNNTSTQEASAEISTSSTSELSFENAIPTLTHKAITRLAEMEIIDYVITQNVDGLHRRSGLPRSKHAVLHGCIFTEKCERCGMEYFRDYDVGGVSFQKTGRKCTKSTSDGICDGDLRDTILDWEDELPEMDWAMSQEQACKADLVLAIGTSLRIEPGKNQLKKKTNGNVCH
jgi:NAD-dependent SIR2 family protein deacetylase